MYAAIDVANYIVKYLCNEGRLHKLNNLKLQKILYYVEGKYLYLENKPFFKDDIEKWKHGPVYNDVYHRFKSYGANPIQEPAYTLKIEDDSDFYSFLGLEPSNRAEKISDKINPEDEKLIKSVVDVLIDKNPFDLVELTHKQPQWYEDEKRIKMGEKYLTYDKEKLITEFKNRNYRVWEFRDDV